jgi:hypothetical protein
METTDRCECCVFVVSEELSTRDIVTILDVTPVEALEKGQVTGQQDVPVHPAHIVRYHSGLGSDRRLEDHLNAVLAFYSGRAQEFDSLSGKCRLTVFCRYAVHREGGWTITADLCRRMADSPFEFVFNVVPLDGSHATP